MFGVVSCVKEDPKPTTDPKPIITYPHTSDTTIQTIPTLVGTTWVMTGIRIGGIGNPSTISDTLKFVTNKIYHYNQDTINYSLYYTGGGFNLTMNGTPWGNLSGTIFMNNLVNGEIMGLKFVDITTGSSNNVNYYVWMSKIH